MTSSIPYRPQDDYTEMRKRWLNRYMRVQGKVDSELKIALIRAAEDAYKQLTSEISKNTFSGYVRSAQIRILLNILKEILNNLFKQELEIISKGNEQAAIAAFTAFTETDRDYLKAVLRESGINVNDFIAAERQRAVLGVGNAVSRLNKSDQSLSQRVYHTRALSNGWVKQRVTAGIVRSASAKEIANDVRKFIRPDVPGGVSYAAMRLGRTEINNAFHATTVALAQDRPWVEGMQWRLSSTHKKEKADLCDVYNSQVFSIDDVPKKPHPQCRCFITPEVEAMETFVRNLTAGKYRSLIDVAA